MYSSLKITYDKKSKKQKKKIIKSVFLYSAETKPNFFKKKFLYSPETRKLLSSKEKNFLHSPEKNKKGKKPFSLKEKNVYIHSEKKKKIDYWRELCFLQLLLKIKILCMENKSLFYDG